MIPVKLTISNFTSYGSSPQELDFSTFHMAAISGLNGAGKSSLLDAITWCVWGTSRLGDNSDQLIHLGQESMFVEFAFLLDEQLFTIKRTRSKKSGGTTSLELLSNFHNLTEGTIKTTQQKIIDILRLTFETFTNSAFLRQNHADEFTTKGATDRKRILADILGLSHYDLLEEKAKEKIKDLQTNLQLLEYQLLEVEAELSQKEEREKRLDEAEQEAKKAESQLKAVEVEINQVEKERELLTLKQQALLEKQTQIEAIKKELFDLRSQIELKEKAASEYQAILEQKTQITKNYQQLQKLQTDKKTLDSKRSELIKVKDEWASLQKVINQREEKRALAIAQLQIQVKELETLNLKFSGEITHLKSHKDSCPTCGQQINAAKNKEIIDKNATQLTENNRLITEYKTKIKKYEEYIFAEKDQAEKLESIIQKIETATKGYLQLVEDINTLEKYDNLNTKLQQAQTAVDTQAEAISDLKKISTLKTEQLQKISINQDDLASFQKQLGEIKTKLAAQLTIKTELQQRFSKLRGEAGEAKQLMARVKQMENLQKEKNEEKSSMQKEREIFEELALAFGKKGIQAMIIETAIPEIEEETNRLLDRLTAGQMRVALVTQRETKTKIVGTGEKGVVETLDIIISDEMGERPYEAYSGGEQFRVNLAIRLALSRLLTNRAGSKLQFLIIDEGFGTQDASGLARIVEALNAIKDDFEKILVITHLDELKEEFPVRIEVSKGVSGSTFEVIGS